MCTMIPETGLVFDAGTAMFRVRERLQTDTLDIFLSHAHLDHVIGLTYLLTVLRDDQLQPRAMRHVRVHGQADKLQAVRQYMFSEHLFPVLPELQWRPLEGPVTLPDGGQVTFFPLQHPGGSVGYRVDWGNRALAYVTDTTAGPDVEYLDRIRGVDLLLHECYLPDSWEDQASVMGHSCLSAVVQLASRAAVGRLVLIHLNPLFPPAEVPELDRARQQFPRTELGMDQMEVVI
jgi:ribonuclease BN (tRNA processing enzyme)